MIPENCSFCQGKLVWKNTDVEVWKADGERAVVEVAAYVCDKCGETYYTPEVSRQLDRIANSR
jgi:YgiT-type zinc finger domain-containing protein